MRLFTAAKAYDDELATSSQSLPAERLARVNEIIGRSERALLYPDGLPQRDWYRHQLYAPGLYTGYGAKTLPGVREAVEAQRWDEANAEAKDAALAIEQLNQHIEEATRLLAR